MEIKYTVPVSKAEAKLDKRWRKHFLSCRVENIIPEGLPIESITRKLSLFERAKTNTVSRTGALPFGFVVLK